jgi:hypothetical protein
MISYLIHEQHVAVLYSSFYHQLYMLFERLPSPTLFSGRLRDTRPNSSLLLPHRSSLLCLGCTTSCSPLLLHWRVSSSSNRVSISRSACRSGWSRPTPAQLACCCRCYLLYSSWLPLIKLQRQDVICACLCRTLGWQGCCTFLASLARLQGRHTRPAAAAGAAGGGGG